MHERNVDWLPPLHTRTGVICALTWDWTHNAGMCPDQESSPQPFGYRTMHQPTEPRVCFKRVSFRKHPTVFCVLICVSIPLYSLSIQSSHQWLIINSEALQRFRMCGHLEAAGTQQSRHRLWGQPTWTLDVWPWTSDLTSRSSFLYLWKSREK